MLWPPRCNETVPIVKHLQKTLASGDVCANQVPYHGRLACRGGLRAKVLTFNLFWWNLFGLRNGDGQRAGRLISRTGWPEPYDIMGFQECDDINKIMLDTGLSRQYGKIQGPHALGLAYRLASWELLRQGHEDVAEDRKDQWYGTRAVMWVKLRNRASGKIVFFLNHHGPLPVSSGGRCGGTTTALQLLKVINYYREPNDDVVLVGDFNSVTHSATIQHLSEHMHRVFSGRSHGGVDHIFASCPSVVGRWNLGSGGSDHDALSTIIDA